MSYKLGGFQSYAIAIIAIVLGMGVSNSFAGRPAKPAPGMTPQEVSNMSLADIDKFENNPQYQTLLQNAALRKAVEARKQQLLKEQAAKKLPADSQFNKMNSKQLAKEAGYNKYQQEKIGASEARISQIDERKEKIEGFNGERTPKMQEELDALNKEKAERQKQIVEVKQAGKDIQANQTFLQEHPEAEIERSQKALDSDFESSPEFQQGRREAETNDLISDYKRTERKGQELADDLTVDSGRQKGLDQNDPRVLRSVDGYEREQKAINRVNTLEKDPEADPDELASARQELKNIRRYRNDADRASGIYDKTDNSATGYASDDPNFTGGDMAKGSTAFTENQQHQQKIQEDICRLNPEKCQVKSTSKEDYNMEKYKDKKDKNCGWSKGLKDSVNCTATEHFVKGSEFGNALAQAAGATSQQFVGQASMADVQKQQGSQAAVLEASAKTAETAAITNSAIGGMNALMGLMQGWRAWKHSDYGDRLGTTSGESEEALDRANIGTHGTGRTAGEQGYIQANNGSEQQLSNSIIRRYKLNDKAHEITENVTDCRPGDEACRITKTRNRRVQYEGKRKEMAAQVQEVADNGQSEHQGMSEMAVGGMAKSLIESAKNFIGAGFGFATAGNLKKAAKELRNADRNRPTIKSPISHRLPGGNQEAPRTGPVIDASGQMPPLEATSETENDASESNLPNIDPPNVGGNPDDLANIIKPGEFDRNANSNGNATNAPLPGLGNNSQGTAAAQAEETPTSQYADSSGRAGAGYAGAGSAPRTSRGGRGNNGNPNLDLAGFLGKFLPKPEEKDERPKDGILSYGARNIASADSSSLLGREADLFDRIHKRYQIQYQRGQLGKR